MRTTTIKKSVIAALVIILATTILLVCKDMTRSIPSSKAIAATMTRALPVGSSRTGVLAYLNGKGIANSGYIASSAIPTEDRTIVAILRERKTLSLIHRSVSVVFHFDDAGRLTAIETRDGYTGP